MPLRHTRVTSDGKGTYGSSEHSRFSASPCDVARCITFSRCLAECSESTALRTALFSWM